MSRRGTAPAKLARLCSKNFGAARTPWPCARRQDTLAIQQECCGTAAFPQRAVHWTWKTSGKRGLPGGRKRMCQRQWSGVQKNSTLCCRPAGGLRIQIGSSRSVQAGVITKTDGCWRIRARRRESARALQRPAEDREGLAAVRPWVARASASWAFCRPVAGVAGSGCRHGMRDREPCCRGMQGDGGAGECSCPQAVCKWPVGHRQAR
jgi:hypothetical protein